jgi:hypothetical protein
MQIFNFDNLKKGDKVGDFHSDHYTGAVYYDEANNDWVHIEFGFLRIRYAQHAGGADQYKHHEVLDPKAYGCEAVCFCEGEFDGWDVVKEERTKRWEWSFVCTDEFFEKNKDSILSHEVKRIDNDDNRSVEEKMADSDYMEKIRKVATHV